MALYSEQDFSCVDTAKTIVNELFPILEKVVRKELSASLFTSVPLCDWDLEDVTFSVKKIEALVSSYLFHLAQMQIEFAKDYVALEDCISDEPSSKLDDFLNSQHCKVLTL